MVRLTEYGERTGGMEGWHVVRKGQESGKEWGYEGEKGTSRGRDSWGCVRTMSLLFAERRQKWVTGREDEESNAT